MTEPTRLQTRLNPPKQDRGQSDGGAEVSGQFVVACSDAPPVLEMRERPFDNVPPFVRVLIQRMVSSACGVLFDDRCGSAVGEEFAERLAVVGGVREHGFRCRKWFDQPWRRLDIMTIAAGQFEGDEPAVSVDNGVNFGRSTASALADGLLLGPPFPPAAQRCAFAVVLSIH